MCQSLPGRWRVVAISSLWVVLLVRVACASRRSLCARAHTGLFSLCGEIFAAGEQTCCHTLRTSHAHPHDRTQITDTVSREAGALTADDRCVCVVDDATLIVVLRTGPGYAFYTLYEEEVVVLVHYVQHLCNHFTDCLRPSVVRACLRIQHFQRWYFQ